jgi:hypothetical protein
MQYFKNKKTYYHERTRRRLEVDVKEEKEESGKAKLKNKSTVITNVVK